MGWLEKSKEETQPGLSCLKLQASGQTVCLFFQLTKAVNQDSQYKQVDIWPKPYTMYFFSHKTINQFYILFIFTIHSE